MAVEMITSKQPDFGPDAGERQTRAGRAPGPVPQRQARRRARPTVGPPTVVAPSPTIGTVVLERAARVIRVLGHPLRLRLLETLEAGERNVSELVAATDASQARVSQHLAILRAEGVVGFRREGGRIYYRITEPKVHRILACIRDCDLPEIAAQAEGGLFDLTGDR
jgi:ArsR family transcriptional regulator